MGDKANSKIGWMLQGDKQCVYVTYNIVLNSSKIIQLRIKLMKFSKQQSLTTDTRLSRSGIFNNSSLNQSNVPLESANNFYMSNNIQNCQNKEVQFLRLKNAQLEQKNKRLSAYVKQLEHNKNQILSINSKYVDVVNRYYQNENQKGDKARSSTSSKKSSQYSTVMMSSGEAHKALEKLEKDHRNLVKHCLAMEEQINRNYTNQMEKFQIMKSQLRTVNHTSVQDLIEQIEQLSQENKSLRKNNNQITYQLEKSKQQCKKMKKLHGAKEKQAGDSSVQVAKMRSLINTTQQKSLDKSNAYQSRIYDLQLKVEKLEKQLRNQQQSIYKTKNMHKDLQIKQVEQVHEYQKLQKSFTDLLRNRDRALSMHSKHRSTAKNISQIGINYAIQRHGASIKNTRRSFVQKSLLL